MMVSFSFFVGIMLVVSFEAFEHFNAALQKEYGMKKRLAPKVESIENKFTDWFLTRYPLISGIFISVMSFILLLIFRVN